MTHLSLLETSTAFGGRWAIATGGFVPDEGDGCHLRNLLLQRVYIEHTEEDTQTCSVCKMR